jgi:uncharacterized membrane protein
MWRRTLLAALGLALGSAVSVALLRVRVDRTDSPYYNSLAWNLFLAWVPFLAALAAYVRFQRRRVDALAGLLLALWLLFFPNAPYVLTDFIHLGNHHGAPLWYDILMLASFAATALLLGFVSLSFVHAIVAASLGAKVSWLLVITALSLASFGVYIGRVLGFNSWDAVVHPIRLAPVLTTHVGDPASHLWMVTALALVTAFLIAGYLPIHAFSASRLKSNR